MSLIRSKNPSGVLVVDPEGVLVTQPVRLKVERGPRAGQQATDAEVRAALALKPKWRFASQADVDDAKKFGRAKPA